MTPTRLSLRQLRSWGFLAEVVERWIPKIEVRRDLFKIADIFAAHPRDGLWLVQCTSVNCLSNRVKKVREQPATPKLLACGIKIECWGWEQRGKHWACRRVKITGTLEPVEIAKRPRRPAGMEQGELFA